MLFCFFDKKKKQKSTIKQMKTIEIYTVDTGQVTNIVFPLVGNNIFTFVSRNNNKGLSLIHI